MYIYDSIHKFEENCLTVNDNTLIKLSFFTDILIYMCVLPLSLPWPASRSARYYFMPCKLIHYIPGILAIFICFMCIFLNMFYLFFMFIVTDEDGRRLPGIKHFFNDELQDSELIGIM